MTSNNILDNLKRLKAIADTGLLYSKNEYDTERYSELYDISLKLLNEFSGNSIEELKLSFPPATDYPTAKVDVRGFMLSPDNKILLVREAIDGKWSLPGGWADIGQSPTETIIKEFLEETGLDIVPASLLAVFDKRLHAHPPEPFYVYKMVFQCLPSSFELRKGFDILDVGYFSVDELPQLSEVRILASQLKLLYNKVTTGDPLTYFD